MEPKAPTVGSSLAVPSVKEVAKEHSRTIPQRYVRLDQDAPEIYDAHLLPQLPIIDLAKLSSEDLKESELARMHHACKEWGFFQLVNHGVSSSLVERVKFGVQEFFNLPIEEKRKFDQREDIEGFGQIFVVSEEQKLDWADLFYLTTLPPNLRKPHLFPKLPLPFREDLEDYSRELKFLAEKLLFFMAQALRMDTKYFQELFDEGWQSIRMNYYPPCPQPKLTIGLSPHSDAIGLTILLQTNEIEGLQIKKDEMWIPVKPLLDAFVVNIGDVLEIITNGMYRSIEHRATVNSVKERLSIATFYGPNLDGEIGPAPSLITSDNPAKFRRIGVADYFKGFFSRELRGKSYVDAMKMREEEKKSSMEPKPPTVGSSLAVPSVKEVAKEHSSTIPQRYVRQDQDAPEIYDAHLLPQLPIIDLAKLSSEDLKESELARMHHACKEWGFFQLVNHGVCSSLVERVKFGVQEFFNLPTEEKKKFDQRGDIEGFGQVFVVSEEQRLDWADLFYLTTLPPNLRKPHLFPKLPLPFREDLEDYSRELEILAKKLIILMAQALRMDTKDFQELFDEGWQSIRMNCYPPCPQPKLAIGLTPHSDPTGLTILLQTDETEGLQIKKDEMWIPIKPLPDAFVVNIGDALEIITNGMYPSIEHRAIVNSVKERSSIATFYAPNLNGEIGPAPSLITPDSPAKFRRIGVTDYYKGLFSRELREKSYVDAMRMQEEGNKGK